MRLKVAVLCLVLVSLASCANAFPLTGGNGQINATVLGTFVVHGAGGDELYIDILFPANYYEHLAYPGVTLVDSEDRFYDMQDMQRGIGMPEYRTPRHAFVSYNIPEKAEIKRIRITPKAGDPFSIEWTGVPEVKGPNIGMKFYGLTSKFPPGSITEATDYTKSWGLDVKITNTGTQKQLIGNDQFEVVDQFGFHYGGKDLHQSVNLLPGESMRFTVVVDSVSMLSRPVYLMHLLSNLTMDISAWV